LAFQKHRMQRNNMAAASSGTQEAAFDICEFSAVAYIIFALHILL